MKQLFTCPAILTKFETRADRTNKLTIHTQELDSAQRAALSSLTGDYGIFAFMEEIADQAVAEKTMADTLNDSARDWGKPTSPSQRLRMIIYRLWEQTKVTQDFEPYYQEVMERIINHYQEKLT